VRVDDHAVNTGRLQAVEDMGQRRAIAHRDQRLGAEVGERSQTRPQTGGEDHGGDHGASIANLAAACAP
jgi:hypothetical protein